jgi:hypothetical protein
MRERGLSVRAIAGVACFALLGISACTGSGATATVSGDPTDPPRSACGAALVLNVRQAPIAVASPACGSPAPLASGSPWPVSIRGAGKAFRQFTGGSDLEFEVSGPFDSASGRDYQLNSTTLDPAGYYVGGSVDADTGLVMAVSYTPRLNDGPGKQLVAFDAAKAKAQDYLALHSVEVTGLTFSIAPTDRGWEMTWEKMVGGVGVTPRVSVTVDWRTGGTVNFSRALRDVGAPPKTVVTRFQAEAAVLGNTWLSRPKVEATTLRFMDWGAAGKLLVWVVYVSGTGDDPYLPSYITYNIDAVTGQPV